jgi:polysaccharide biosynthesis protein PslG
VAQRLRKVALALGAALVLPAAFAGATTAQPLGGINLAGLGASSTPAGADAEFATALSLHAKAIRIEVPWPVLQPDGPGALNPGPLPYLDRLLDDAAKHGVTVIALVDVTPCWASSAPAQLRAECTPGMRSAANSWPPANPGDFAALVGALAARYGNRLTAIEVWNEPDQANEKYFAGPEKAQRYAALLRAAYTAIKQADPSIQVLGGSLVGSDGIFLRKLYAAGIQGYYDGFAVHFYTLTLAALREFRAAQLAAGDSKPLWLDEFGWSSCYPQLIQEEQACVTAGVQAQNITSIFRSLARTPYVAADTLYKLRDSGNSDFGVLAQNGVHKLAFGALAGVLASPRRKPPKVSLSLSRSRGHLVASGAAPVGDYMRLEAFKHRALRFRAQFTLDRFNRYRLTLPGVLGTRGLTVRVYQEWTGPRAAAQKRS